MAYRCETLTNTPAIVATKVVVVTSVLCRLNPEDLEEKLP